MKELFQKSMKKLLDKAITILNKGSNRSVKARKNILMSFVIRLVSIVIGFVFVPLLVHYLGTSEYGIWITMSSVIAWVSYFDVGMGNGLRNRFAESLARGEHKLARIYVSTTYAALSMIFGILFVLFLVVNPFLNWSDILNTPREISGELSTLATLTVGFFLLRFILRLISVIITADQRPAIANLFDPLANVVSLIAILILMKTTEPSLINLGLVLGLSPVVVLLAASIIFYTGEYKKYRPSFRQVQLNYFKDLVGLGLQFFIIQITVVVIMSTNNLIITQVVGPEAVTSYNIAYKYFGLISMGFVIITNTYWSAFTEAYVKKDFGWIKRILRNLMRLWGLIIVVVAIMLLFADKFYLLWIGPKVQVPWLLSVFTALFIIIYVWYSIFIYFINGTGKIKLQLYTSVAVALMNIPVSIFFASHLELGAAGVILGSCVTYLPGAIIAPLQYRRIVRNTDTGIWGK